MSGQFPYSPEHMAPSLLALKIENDKLYRAIEGLAVRNEELRVLAGDLLLCARNGGNCLKCAHGRFCDMRFDERCKELEVEEST